MTYPQVVKEEGFILKTLQEITEDDFFRAVEISWIKDDSIKKAKNLLEASHLTVGYGT